MVLGCSPELLAPAGSLEAALTAFDCGADAVYVGLPRFNARERGSNCSRDEVARLITYARRHGRKVYIALNTLVKETELVEVAEILAYLEPLAPHAVLVQDLGVLHLVRRYFPALAIHASTQMGTHNSAGVALLGELGVRRVILERQTTFAEVRSILERTSVEVEVFVHGALCCSLSGTCLFSSWYGGWSGNRGKCKQPCRRRFFAPDGNGFFFSTRDLCLIHRVRELRNMGVAAFKIEGRLRDPDYVRQVVTAYRRVLDAGEEDAETALGEAKMHLARSLGRRWSTGFSRPEDFRTVIEHRSLGTSGLLAGKIVDTRPGGFTIRLSRPLVLGDRIRLQPASGDEGPAMTVTRLAVGGHAVRRAAAGSQECFVACDRPVPRAGFVYRIGRAQRSLRHRIAKLPAPACGVHLHVRVRPDHVEIGIGGIPGIGWRQQTHVERARKHPTAAETVRSEFAKSGSAGLIPADISVDMLPDLFLPGPVLREWRKAFWEWLETQDVPGKLEERAATAVAQVRADLAVPIPTQGTSPICTVYCAVTERRGGGDEVSAPELAARIGASWSRCPTVTARDIRHLGSNADEAVLPFFCPEQELDALATQIAANVSETIRRVRVTGLFQFRLLAGKNDRTITASFPLPVANSFALEALMELGADRATAWVELDEPALLALRRRAGDRLETFAYGSLPILVTRAELPRHGWIRDARGENFRIVSEDGLTLLLPGQPIRIPPRSSATYVDLSRSLPEDGAARDASRFNFDREMR